MVDKKVPMSVDEIFVQFEFGLTRLRELFVAGKHRLQSLDDEGDPLSDAICREVEKMLEAVGESLVACYHQVDEDFRKMDGVVVSLRDRQKD